MQFLNYTCMIALFYYVSVQYTVANTCRGNDVNCQFTNISNSDGTLISGKCQKEFILNRKPSTSLLSCIKECFLTSQCEGINYRKGWNLCELVTNATSENLSNEQGCSFSEIISWPRTLAGNCIHHGCPAGTKCLFDNGNKTCVLAYCKDPPPIFKYATSAEKFGMSRDIGTAFKLKCDDGFQLIRGSLLICSPEGNWVTNPSVCCMRKDSSLLNNNIPRGCHAVPRYCDHGVYKISPQAGTEFKGYCHISGVDHIPNWLMIQRRWYNSVSFVRNWAEYEQGFGDLYSGFWLGNKYIHAITSTGDYFVRFDLTTHDGQSKYVRYAHFKVGSSETNYKLNISGYDENSDASSDVMSYHNGMQFSTYDADHDLASSSNCARDYSGGWWYSECHLVNLNGLFGYFNGLENPSYWAQGIQWYSVTYHEVSLKYCNIWIRLNTV